MHQPNSAVAVLTVTIYAVCLASILLLAGCSMPSIKQPVDVETYYYRDAIMTVNGMRRTGVMVVPWAEKFEIHAELKGDSKFRAIRTCHREWIDTEEERGTIKYTYIPRSMMEAEDRCPIEVVGFTKTDQAHSWGTIYFEQPNGVWASLRCNGIRQERNTTACHSRVGTIQEIRFKKEMLVKPEMSGCDYQMKETRGKYFEYTMPAKKCTLVFAEVESKGEKHHTHFSEGYQGVLLRE